MVYELRFFLWLKIKNELRTKEVFRQELADNGRKKVGEERSEYIDKIVGILSDYCSGMSFPDATAGASREVYV